MSVRLAFGITAGLGCAVGCRPRALTPTTLVRALTTKVARALTTAPTTSARRTYATLARNLGPHADFDPPAAVIALKRLGPTQHVHLLRTALGAGLSVPALWRATCVRPLATAVARLTPDLREHARLTPPDQRRTTPPNAARTGPRPEIAPAHAMDVVARATRKAIVILITDEALTRSVARHPTPELVCAVIIATTCAEPSTVDNTAPLVKPGTTTVPSFPTTDLLDEHGPWQQALTAAAELGAPVESFGLRIAERGLHAPAALLGKNGWATLWHRTHR